jgi:hypothetical protein
MSLSEFAAPRSSAPVMLTSRSGDSDLPTLHGRRVLVLLTSFDEVLSSRARDRAGNRFSVGGNLNFGVTARCGGSHGRSDAGEVLSDARPPGATSEDDEGDTPS